MSEARFSLAFARAEGAALRRLVGPGCTTGSLDEADGAGGVGGWFVAGSVRRGRAAVKDVEHVVVPAFGDRPPSPATGALFPERANLLMARLDDLLAGGLIVKAGYSDGTTRWGDKYRGLRLTDAGRAACGLEPIGGPLAERLKHEVFTVMTWAGDGGAACSALGYQLATRTGPAELSRVLVTRLRSRGYCAAGGRVYGVRPGECDGVPVSTPDEASYFALCGVELVPPSGRAALAERLEGGGQ